ncbi:hypothetical protein E2562_000463 [Oryza meyeriana var. granulata]|uniref:Peptidase A1 domain-containing protein n=1 Tax=Oryza meyeriana var. granulata TaxID=110450 RepID=A0A6G1CCH8_9ORYZ|nr:hypothetical protein E2562_000463 [Oryza meyeriana var. granulata]
MPAPTFLPSESDTFAKLPCSSQMCQDVLDGTCAAADSEDCTDYELIFGDAETSGYLAIDTFTFGETSVPGIVFGCNGATHGDFSGASGVIGLGSGPLSLVSQLQLSNFSYQLGYADSDGDGTSETTITFDAAAAAVPQTKQRRRRSTPLLTSTLYPDLYYVNLIGIRVDGDLTGIPAGTFDLQEDGSGGVFLSTTAPETYLEEAAYHVVKQAIQAKLQLPPVDGSAVGLDLCYTAQSMASVSVKVLPKLTLVFDGDDATMDLRRANYFFKDNVNGLECLTMKPWTGGSLLGSLLQTGTNMIYDMDREQLTFEAAATSRVSPAPLKMIVAVVMWVLLS